MMCVVKANAMYVRRKNERKKDNVATHPLNGQTTGGVKLERCSDDERAGDKSV